MSVEYEWDVETVDEHGDIIDHNFTYKLKSGIINLDEIDGKIERLVLVRDGFPGDGSMYRSWAYCNRVDGKWVLPYNFEDAYGRFEAKVPQRFINELERQQRK